MHEINAFIGDKNKPVAKFKQLALKRDWMSNTTYHCTPIASANVFGYGVYFDEDLSFIWDGDKNNSAKAILGKDILWEGRGEGSITFLSNLFLRTNEDVSLLTIPVPNQFTEDATCISTIISSSFFSAPYPITWKIHTPNKEIFIPSGTPVACLLPISVGQIHNSNINISYSYPEFDLHHSRDNYVKKLKEEMSNNKHPKWYKYGTDENGFKIGNHEVDKFNLDVTSSNYISKAIGSKNSDTKSNMWVEAVYPDLIRKIATEGKIYDIKDILALTSSTFSDYKSQYRNPETPWLVSELNGSSVSRLFKFISYSSYISAISISAKSESLSLTGNPLSANFITLFHL